MSKVNNIYAVIMAGGRGERFWPLGRRNRPKQLLNLTGNATLIEEAVQRLYGLVPPERVLVITNHKHVEPIRELLPIPAENVIGEPIGRDTSPCVALAAGLIRRQDPEATMILLPADHVITPAKALCDLLQSAAAAAQSGALVTIGIKPDRPATGYGYIHRASPLAEAEGFFDVLGFREKPDLATAEKFLASGEYLWNSGMFIWRIDAIMRELSRQRPALAALADAVANAAENELEKVILREYNAAEPLSIDYAVMEGAERVIVGESTFAWDDIGSWSALRGQRPLDDAGNVKDGNIELADCRDCIVMADSLMVGAVGLEGMVIIQSGNGVLVCRVEDEQRVKELVRAMDANGRSEFI